jgi:hypothetical protein
MVRRVLDACTPHPGTLGFYPAAQAAGKRPSGWGAAMGLAAWDGAR